MKFRQKIILHLLIYVVISTSLLTLNNWSAVDTGDIVDVPDPVIHIPDPNLEQALRKEMELHPNLKITKARIARLGTLNVSNQGIKDLTGLEHAVRLMKLIIAFNPVSDLTPLADLRGLRHLDARECNISDLTPLTNLRYLVELQLSGNQIEDIAPVENLPRLRRLEIDDNPLADSSILEQFEPVEIPDLNLRSAICEELGFPDDAPITRGDMLALERLEIDRLEPHDRQHWIKKLDGLEHAINLAVLIIPVQKVYDLSPLAGLKRLVVLGVHENPIQDLTPISDMTQLDYLGVNACPVSDLRPLATLTNLRRFDAIYCGMTDISPIANLTQLHTLHLEHNRIEDITPLAGLTELQKLYLENNRIKDLSPLVGLINLEILRIHNNLYTDTSPLSGLNVPDLQMDEECDMPRLSVRDRLANRNLPSIPLTWHDGIFNRGGDWWDLSIPYRERVAYHDIWWHFIDQLGTVFKSTPQGYQIMGSLQNSMNLREEFLAHNPNMLFIADVRQYYAPLGGRFPDDWIGWLRDENGDHIFFEYQYEGLMVKQAIIDYASPEVQDIIVQRALAVSKCGLFDGIIYDHWGGNDYSILRRIRENVPDDFLILVNTNERVIPGLIPYINGAFMETFPVDRKKGYTRDRIIEIEEVLVWYESNALEPKINCLRGLGIGTEPPDSPANRRWMRLFTTMSLTLSDGYTLYSIGDVGGHEHFHKHIWHPFWDANLGQAVGPMAERYKRIDGVYIREFTNGWAVYNRSGEPQVITLPEKAQGVASGLVNTEHALPNLDGEIYLRVKPKNPADVNSDGVVNILDLTIVAQGFGTDSKKGDVNGDGFVNILDLVFVANQF